MLFKNVATLLCFIVLSSGMPFASFAEIKPTDPSNYDHPVRVACIGDSITFGVGAVDGMSYPAQLQTLLGPRWRVENFGVRGRTLLRKGDFPWWNENVCQDAQDFQPDVVIIMLGTNDTKPANWVHKDDFYNDYADLVDVFEKLPSHPQIYVCRPTPVPEPGHWGINEANLQLEIPLIGKLAKERGLGEIDMHTALRDDPKLFPDRVHPSTRGALIMAETAFSALTGKPVPPRVNSYFADHMVLQRNKEIKVWGPAPDGERVAVEFAGQKVQTTAINGRWTVALQPMAANAVPQIMIISNGNGGVRTIHDILIGDVWVASGQSNMERQLGPRRGQKQIAGWKEAVASATYPLIRQYQLPEIYSARPLADGYGTWIVCSPETAADFCAVGYFFIRDVFESQKIPLAIIHTAWGGTPAEAWTSLDRLKTVPEYAQLANSIEDLSQHPEKMQSMRQTWFKENDAGTMSAWWAEDITSNGWHDIQVPAYFEAMGIHKFDGVVWFRKAFELPAAVAGTAATLQLGQIDDSDSTWVNGKLIGETDGWTKMRNYTIPAGVLKAGHNVIAIRVLDTSSKGGWADTSGELSLTYGNGEESITAPLSGTWQEKIGTPLTGGAAFYVRGRLNQNSPAMLFNAMINPLMPLPIKGVIWYQGESNNDHAKAYENLFAALIDDWRARWNDGADFPFLFVQIAPYKGMSPELRESQRCVLAREPNTAMAVTVDVGDANDIHPARKEPVGHRLALAARALAYGEKIEYSGPLYQSMTVTGGQAILHFTHIGKGLEAKGEKLKGFEISGTDGVYVPAHAKIDDDTVVVSSDKVAAPRAVRYGWANVPDVNLFNKDGLPASPFSTKP